MPKLSLAKLERHLYAAADRLRQEGLDAATYKDYIFGMLFLKRCSDVFEAERDRIVGRKVEQGMVEDEALSRYGENPDYYDGFFVPERARWRYLQSRLGDSTEPYGKVLDKVLGALSEYNESLEHVLDHMDSRPLPLGMTIWRGWIRSIGRLSEQGTGAIRQRITTASGASRLNFWSGNRWTDLCFAASRC